MELDDRDCANADANIMEFNAVLDNESMMVDSPDEVAIKLQLDTEQSEHLENKCNAFIRDLSDDVCLEDYAHKEDLFKTIEFLQWSGMKQLESSLMSAFGRNVFRNLIHRVRNKNQFPVKVSKLAINTTGRLQRILLCDGPVLNLAYAIHQSVPIRKCAFGPSVHDLNALVCVLVEKGVCKIRYLKKKQLYLL